MSPRLRIPDEPANRASAHFPMSFEYCLRSKFRGKSDSCLAWASQEMGEKLGRISTLKGFAWPREANFGMDALGAWALVQGVKRPG